jgi:hypothetical protein
MTKAKQLMDKLFCPECDNPLSIIGRHLDKGWCGHKGHPVMQVYQFSRRRRFFNCVGDFLIKVLELIKG